MPAPAAALDRLSQRDDVVSSDDDDMFCKPGSVALTAAFQATAPRLGPSPGMIAAGGE
jgi:hypothetical protein